MEKAAAVLERQQQIVTKRSGRAGAKPFARVLFEPRARMLAQGGGMSVDRGSSRLSGMWVMGEGILRKQKK